MKTVDGIEAHRVSRLQVSDFKSFALAFLQIKKAAARANSISGELTGLAGEAIAQACDQLGKELDLLTADPVSGGGAVLINAQVNELIAARAGRPVTEVNLSQSTADTVATALRVSLVKALLGSPGQSNKGLVSALGKTSELMELNSKKFADNDSIARTCLRDAMPTKLGTLFSGYHSVLVRRRVQLIRIAQELSHVNIGGTVIGSGEGASHEYKKHILVQVSKETGLNLKARANLFDAAQNADDIGSLGHELALLCEAMIKIAKDLRLLHSGPEHGLNEIELPKVINGSSFFKNKNNPTVPETVLQACFVALGHSRTIGLALEHAELNLNVFEPLAGFTALDALELLTNTFVAFNEHCLNDIST